MADYTATYVSANTFKIEGEDASNVFVATERVCVMCSGVAKYSSISSVSYSAPDTTVVLTQSVLTDPCGSCYPGGVMSGPTGNIPTHTHEDDNTGGLLGVPTQYQYTGTQIRLMNPDGTWGPWVNLAESLWLVGNGDPNDALGSDGNFYLDIGEAAS